MDVMLTYFGETKYTFYEFENLEKAETDFGDAADSIIRLPGNDGGFNLYGKGRSPGSIGKVTANFYLTADDPGEMTLKRDLVKAMKSWGRKRLWMQPLDRNEQPRWAFAVISSISMPEDANGSTEFLQPVNVTWQVPDPFWYNAGTETIWGNFKWGDGSLWGGPAAGIAFVDTYDLVINYQGTAPTYIRTTIKPTGASAVGSLTVQRIKDGEAIDRWTWGGTLLTGTRLEVDPRQRRILLGAVDSSALFSSDSADWLMIEPGVNTIRINTKGSATVWFRYMGRYY